jgi:hypothetical protein
VILILLSFQTVLWRGFRDELKAILIFFRIYDPNAGSDYGVMYALPGVLLLSFIKGLHVLLMNVVFIIMIIVFLL